MNHSLLNMELFEEGPVVVFVWKNESGWPVESVTNNLLNIYGYEPSQYLCGQLNYINQIHPDDLSRVSEELTVASKNLNSNSFVHQPYRYLDSLGKYRWVKDSSQIIRSKNGDVTHYIGYLIDISDEIKLQEESEYLKERLDLAWNGINDGLWDWDIEQNKVYFSPRWKEMIGYAPDEFPHDAGVFFDEIHPGDQPRVEDLLKRHFLDPKNIPYEIDIRLRCKNGEYKWIRTRGKTSLKANGTPHRMVGAHTDISEYKKQIESNELMQRRYASMFNKHHSIMLLINPRNGAIIDANESAQKFYGYSYDEFLALSIEDINQLAHDKITLRYQETIERENNHFIFQHKLQNGDIRIVEVFASPIDTENGELIFSIIRDITHQNEVELELQEKHHELQKAQLKFQTLFEESLDGIVLMDPKTQKFVEFNHHACEMYGYTKEEFGLLSPKDLDALHDEERIIATQQAILKNGWDKFTTKHKTKDGTLKDIIVSVKVFTMDNNHVLHATFHDITQQKNRELHLQTLLNEQEALYKVQTVGFVHLKDRQLKWTNEIFESMLGYEKGELQGQSARIMYQDEEEYANYGRDGYVALNTTGVFTREINAIKKDGTKLILLASMTSLHKDATEAVGIAFDITEMKKQAETIEKQHEEFKTIFDISRDGIAILDLESNFLDFNDAYLAMTGFSREELLATSCIALAISEDNERAIKAMEIVFEFGFLESFEKTCIVKNGKSLVIRMAMSLMPDKKRIMISTKDVTDIRDHEKQLEFIAHFDPLTKLPNRSLFSDRMKQSIANAHRNNQKLAIAYLDLDGFKQVNDTHGHNVGDLLLIEVSNRMQNALREGDTIARFGGDEFVIILGNQNDENETFAILNRVLDAASSPVDIANTVITVSASIGVTFYSKEYDIHADILLRQADQAMYEAKLRGKNQIAVFDDISDLSNQVGESALAIKNALLNNEFMLHYQPKVNMKSGEVIGAEALIRWNDPVRGIVYPDDFLSIVDNRPLMYEIDQWVFNEALSQLSRWYADGFDTKVSINISAYTFKQPNFFSLIDDTLAKHPNIKPHQIDIEILESSSLHEIEDVRKIIEQLHERNITVSLDDFGTGYSTLSYLKKLGIDTLKIDKSFVLDILHDLGDLSIVDASVGLAEAFRAKPSGRRC